MLCNELQTLVKQGPLQVSSFRTAGKAKRGVFDLATLCLLVIFLDKTKSFLLISFLRLVFGKQTRFHYAYRSK
ncbi:unnamed protein product, partial [Vitis vinifera]|uniref:Uncharacterized protein n=1 Tax=Vitis vinifera TaxID=29760 RepID=E0CQK5_VITVI